MRTENPFTRDSDPAISQGGMRVRTSSRPPPPIGVVVPARDPLTRVMDLGSSVAARGVLIGIVFTLFVHGTAMARAALIPLELIRWTQSIRAEIHNRLVSSYEIDVLKVPPPPEPAPVPDEAKPEVKEPPPPVVVKTVKEDEPPPPPPAAAQAGAILTDPNEPIDFTGGGFAVGNAATFAGGVTHASGTSTTAVRDHGARPDGVPGGTGAGPVRPPTTPDRTRAATRSGSSDWKCPWPAEADAEQIDDAFVTVQVSVKPNGHADKVAVLNDPGHGFGREARLCAMRETYNAAFDREGNAISGETKAFRIHFER